MDAGEHGTPRELAMARRLLAAPLGAGRDALTECLATACEQAGAELAVLVAADADGALDVRAFAARDAAGPVRAELASWPLPDAGEGGWLASRLRANELSIADAATLPADAPAARALLERAGGGEFVVVPDGGGREPHVGLVVASSASRGGFDDETLAGLGSLCRLLGLGVRRMEAEARLLAAARRATALSEAASEALVVVRAGRIADCNEVLCELLGRPRDALVGTPPSALVDEPSRGEVARRVRDHVGGVYEATVVTGAGERVPVEVRSRELEIEGEKVRAVTLRDIRERKAAERAAQEAAATAHALLETAFEGVMVCDAGEIIAANAGLARMWGYEPAEVIGMPRAALHPEGSFARPELPGDRRMEPVRTTALRQDGTTFPVETLEQSSTWGGRPVRIVGYRDLSRQLAEEAERAALEARMIQAQRVESLGMLAGGIAHDFNNLLVGVIGNADLVEVAVRAGRSPLVALGRLRAAAKQAANLTQQLLTYAGRRHPRPQPVVMAALCRELVELTATMRANGQELRLVLPDEELPPALGDRSQLSQVLLNLLTNAAEAMQGRAGTITVGVETVSVEAAGSGSLPGPPPAAGRYLRLWVADEGHGMDVATRERMFDPFYSSHGTGRGLGLAAVVGVVRAHAGGLGVDSEVGRGTTVSVLLPIADGAVPAGSDAPLESQRPPRPLRVLVVDDKAAILAVTRSILGGAGHEVLMATDGEAGLRLWRAERETIDVVVLDVAMPGLGGEEVFQQLVTSDPAVRVLFCSGFQPSSAIEALLAREGVGFLQKPFEADELVAAVTALAPSRRAT